MLAIPVHAQERIPPQSREQVQLSYAPVVKNVMPAVVNIYASKRVQVRTSPFAVNPLFEEFFSRNPLFDSDRFGLRGFTKERIINSLGSGVIIDPSGLIITNYHVISQGDDIRIALNDRREFKAVPVLIDKQTDLALLKLEGDFTSLPYLDFAPNHSLEVGDIVLAVGNPFGIGQTVTSGIVSALARTTVGVADYEFFIQTDAAINPGNSGGALVDLYGHLAGINTAIYSKSGGSAGIGFATPSVMAQLLVNSYKQGYSRVMRPWIGASTQSLTQELAESLNLASPSGVLVNNVYEGSPAEKGGLQRGDVILSMDGQPVTDEEGLKFHIATKPLGSSAALGVFRDGAMATVSVVMQLPDETTPRQEEKVAGNNPLTGATLSNLSPAVAYDLGIETYKGVIIVAVEPGSVAGQFFQKGDVIEAVNGVAVASVKQLLPLLENSERGWKIVANRGGQKLTVSLMR